ncbi:MAG TPA: hypothetical protein IAB39_07345 [Candidatus Onthovicinus excrementipullorum]|nr:hypothetical protein [Candidatus Onthovicinus excrementipullorum]
MPLLLVCKRCGTAVSLSVFDPGATHPIQNAKLFSSLTHGKALDPTRALFNFIKKYLFSFMPSFKNHILKKMSQNRFLLVFNDSRR